MPEAVDGTITLTEDVVLPSTLVLGANSNVKVIDLNGHTLSRGTRYGYLINSSTDLTIKNGSIVCGKEQAVIDGEKAETKSSSCIRNNKSLNVDAVKVKAYWTALKDEEGTTLTLKNSTVSSESGTAGTILNYGDARIENSTIKAASVPNGAAIFTMSYAEGDNKWGSTVVVNDSTIQGYFPVLLGKYDDYSEANGLATTVTFEGDNTIITDGKFLQKNTQREDTTLEISGEVTAAIDAIDYVKNGTVLTVNEDITKAVVIPDGVTLIIPEGIKVTGSLKMDAGAVIINKSGETVNVLVELDGKEETIELQNNGKLSMDELTKEPDTPVEPDLPNKPNEPSEPTEPSEPEVPKDDHQPSENPKTFDGVTAYAAFAGISIGGLGLVLKKKLD